MTSGVDETHDPALTSWVASANGHPDFPIQNLPFGVFSCAGAQRHIGVAIGDRVFDLTLAAQANLLSGEAVETLSGTTLNALLALKPQARIALRQQLSTLLSDQTLRAQIEPMLFEMAECTLHLPAAIGDYTDFYAGIHHANNVGRLFRPDNPLLPNYKHIPIGYHGRASSIRVSGEPVIRPRGQRKPPDAEIPSFGATQRLDYELELGVWIGQGNALGTPIRIGQAHDHIAGFCLLNDWSARDLQAWEYQPLGPFLAKSFHSTISPWVITAEALAPFRKAQPSRPASDPRPLGYLWDDDDQATGALSIDLEIHVSSARMRDAGMAPQRLAKTAAVNLYWTVAQLLTHHASNGCNLNPGDLLGTGTISSATSDGFGSLLELNNGGRDALHLPTGETRLFLEDGDEICLSATASAPGYISIGFGECRAIIRPAA